MKRIKSNPINQS